MVYTRRRGVVGRVPAFQPGGPGSIPGGVRNFNFCPGIGCVSFVCVLSCVVSRFREATLVYMSSILVKRHLLPLQTSYPRGSSSPSVFCPKAGPSLQAEKPRLQLCLRQVFHRKLRKQGCSVTGNLIGAVASRWFPHPTLYLASEQTLKDLKRSQGHQRGGEESGFG